MATEDEGLFSFLWHAFEIVAAGLVLVLAWIGRGTVARVDKLEDGQVTPEELRDIYTRIDKIDADKPGRGEINQVIKMVDSLRSELTDTRRDIQEEHRAINSRLDVLIMRVSDRQSPN